jgi:hypothetical protein
MHGVDNNCVRNSAAILLVNRIKILLRSSPGTLGVGLVMLLRVRGIVTTWCTEGGDKTDNVIDLIQLRGFPDIAAVYGMVLDGEPHQRSDRISSRSSLATRIAKLLVCGLLKPCFKAKNGFQCSQHCIKIVTVLVTGKCLSVRQHEINLSHVPSVDQGKDQYHSYG